MRTLTVRSPYPWHAGGALGFWRLPGGILTAVHRNAAKVEAAGTPGP